MKKKWKNYFNLFILIVFIILIWLIILNFRQNLLFQSENEKITIKEYENKLWIDKIEIPKTKISELQNYNYNNVYFSEIKNNFWIFTFWKEGKRYELPLSILDKKVKEKLIWMHLKKKEAILIIFDENKKPIDFHKLKSGLIVKNVTIDKLEDIITNNYYNSFELRWLNSKKIFNKEWLDIIKWLLDRKKNENDFDLPYSYTLFSNDWKKEYTINELNKVNVAYFKLEDWKYYLIFSKINHLYTKNEKKSFQNYNIEIKPILNKEIKDKIYLKYKESLSDWKYIFF